MTSPLAPGVALPGADVHAQLEEDVDRLIDELPPSVGGQKVMLDGDAGQALVDQGRFASDAMVVGSHGFGRILRFMAGSVASSVVRAAPWPVFVVPEHGRLPFANAGRPL
jgi:nucleotide-binding universal stress UspA family protein